MREVFKFRSAPRTALGLRILSMLTYVQHLSTVPVLGCWYKACYKERDANRSKCKMGNTPPLQLHSTVVDVNPGTRTECSIRRRLLASKVHQRPESLWTPKPMLRAEGKGTQGDTLTRSQSCCKRNSMSCVPCKCTAFEYSNCLFVGV